MRLIKPSFEILPYSGNIFKDIELAARTCYKSEDKMTDDSAEKMVEMLIKNKHTAMLEHGSVYLTIPNTDLGFDIMCKYRDNKYSVITYDEPGFVIEWFITTNYRVIIENDWLSDLQYITEPDELHEKRISVKFVCDRGVSHEFVRHRVFSFAQESTRYCNYSKDKFGNELTFIIPCWTRFGELNWKFTFNKSYIDNGIHGIDISMWEENIENYDKFSDQTYDSGSFIWVISLLESEVRYFDLINRLGWKPQEARSVLPNSLKTELVMTGFVSDWKGFFILRDAPSAHPQARELAQPLHEEFKKLNLI